MKTSMAATLVIAAAIGVSAARSSTPARQTTPPDKKEANKNLTLVGCVQAADSGADQFTLSDKDQIDATYRLTGADMKKYVGQRVRIVGGVVSPRVTIKGGLLPSPNAAGQAGAIDPSRAAIAGGAGGTASATGNPTLPEFRVRTVRPVPGDCKP